MAPTERSITPEIRIRVTPIPTIPLVETLNRVVIIFCPVAKTGLIIGIIINISAIINTNVVSLNEKIFFRFIRS
jgi:hypothetical protein